MSFDELDALLNEGGTAREKGPALPQPIVLIVDDNQDMRESLALILRERYDVRLCASALEGVEALVPEVAVVILDVRMKGRDGFWACKAIRKRNAHVPVIFYSAYQDVKDPYEIMNEYQPFGYVTKGRDISYLLNMIERAVKYSEFIQSNQRAIDKLEEMRTGAEQKS